MGGLAWNTQQQQHFDRGGDEWKKWSGRVGIGVVAQNTVRMELSDSVGRTGGGRTLATGGVAMELPGCGNEVCTMSTFFLPWDSMRAGGNHLLYAAPYAAKSPVRILGNGRWDRSAADAQAGHEADLPLELWKGLLLKLLKPRALQRRKGRHGRSPSLGARRSKIVCHDGAITFELGQGGELGVNHHHPYAAAYL